MEPKNKGLSVSISVMDVEPMKLVLDVVKDMIDDPEVRVGYKLRLCAALNLAGMQTPEP